ncbi:DegV family protein [Mycoplasma bradburyae]|uniref:DegV family protein n=1 Tax=Mycoplasma bradburyae TaxID=2963128 RepID=A0AAW6HQM4_9MOLU|nr:DegV family protein [Mycoplasma bradburyae]MDC4163349.1 DegV family protein [Mycoplasma bradburyae]MDC4181963.1 DegV family protein [Mycoplasma bradburyae]MDC4182666.1 DegV family protein [Mycoplasma bradburyae]MDC4183338.1 DegV family protein [Mycoplasma bradburyae]MDC4184146.1 DegV family protein [Mycoplasma bradburyae]
MKKIAIITDSSSTIKTNELKDVFVVPLQITINNTNTYLDGVDIQQDEIYDYLSKDKNVDIKTSMPVIESILKTTKEVASNYDHVFVLPISSGLSGTYSQWKMVIETELSDLKNISIFDTCDTAISLKWLVNEVQQLISQDKSIKEIEEYIENWKNRIYTMIVVNDLTQLRKGGRISKMKSLIAGILKISPIISFHKGVNQLVDKAINIKTAIEKCIEQATSKLKLTKNKIVKLGFCHTFKEDKKTKEVLKLVKEGLKSLEFNELDVAMITPVIGVHTGINAFALSFLIDK